nr:glycosyltransferase family 92 protein [Tanacetum cinerariifolium]
MEKIRRARPQDITANEWDKYIQFWNDPINIARAAQNRQNRAKSTVISRQGSRSLTRLRDEMRQSSTNQEYSSHVDTFFVTHTINGKFLRDEDRRIYFESGGASGSGGCGDDEESTNDQDDEDEDGDDDTKRGSFISRCSLALIFFSCVTFSTLRLLVADTYHPSIVSSWLTSPTEATSTDLPASHDISVGGIVLFPDQVLILLKYPPTSPLLAKHDITCIYSSPNTSKSLSSSAPLSIGGEYHDHQIVRCDVAPRGMLVSVGLKWKNLPPGPTYEWKSLAYEAVIDDVDNTSVVFVKGLNLRSGKASNASRYKCVYLSDFTKGQLVVRSKVLSIAQEIVRCRTPLSILEGLHEGSVSNSVKVSVKVNGGGVLRSIARPEFRAKPNMINRHQVCVCTMVRNQARFLDEWVTYHGQIGVERWFIYDNNSDDDIEETIESLVGRGYKIIRQAWPWIKTQEAGFSHCALRARDYYGFKHVDINRNLLVINHYKFQVWEVFKEKFYRRVSAYVSDWQQEENLKSNDRTPGLGTQVIEPGDWPRRFCEINDTGLRDWVVNTFSDPYTGILPWQKEERVL